ncbi:MAG: hypothetical protein ACLR8Y_18935 [Alistipes indistinctus]
MKLRLFHSCWGTSFDDEALARQNAAKYDSLSKAHNDLGTTTAER